jgi:hypothetical protein
MSWREKTITHLSEWTIRELLFGFTECLQPLIKDAYEVIMHDFGARQRKPTRHSAVREQCPEREQKRPDALVQTTRPVLPETIHYGGAVNEVFATVVPSKSTNFPYCSGMQISTGPYF